MSVSSFRPIIPLRAKSITRIKITEKTTILRPGIAGVVCPKIFIGSSKNLSHSDPPITKIVPIIAPVVEPRPPSTMMIRRNAAKKPH